MSRRLFIGAALGACAGAALIPSGAWALDINVNILKKKDGEFPYQLTDAQWRGKLSPEAYRVLREAGTEPAGSSPLYDEKRKGIYHCAGCGAALFSSETKYQSCTGWPSFWAPVSAKAVDTSTDFKIVVPRTEVHCANCGGHLGHKFDDGPPQSGWRYCMNGVALDFRPAV